MLYIIAAMANNRVIGREGHLPWSKLRSDMTRFREKTGSSPVFMGSKTFHSLPPKFRPLPGRENIVLTRNENLIEEDGVTIVSDIAPILKRAEAEDVFVIGGAEVYALMLPHADCMEITHVHTQLNGDAFFPEWDPVEWNLTHEERFPADQNNAYALTFQTYWRKHKFIELANCRNAEQKKVMKTIANAGHCPFCTEQFENYHKKPVLWSGQYWNVSENMWPYEHSKIHLVLFLKDHAENINEIPTGAFEEIGTVLKWASETFGIEGGGFYMRFGDCLYTGGTVRHIHAHIASKSSITDPTLKFYLG